MRYSENFQGLFSCQTQELLNVIAKPLFHYLGDFCAVLIGERKVRIALDADVLSLTPKSLGP